MTNQNPYKQILDTNNATFVFFYEVGRLVDHKDNPHNLHKCMYNIALYNDNETPAGVFVEDGIKYTLSQENLTKLIKLIKRHNFSFSMCSFFNLFSTSKNSKGFDSCVRINNFDFNDGQSCGLTISILGKFINKIHKFLEQNAEKTPIEME